MTLPHSDALVFFGATGDLAYKKIFPALQAMVRLGRLNAPVIGVAKADWNLDHLKARARDSVDGPLPLVVILQRERAAVADQDGSRKAALNCYVGDDLEGASRGIGAEIARLFASEGGRVVCAARTLREGDHQYEGSLETTVAAIRAAGGEATPVAVDISEESECEKLIKAAHDAYGPIDVLVNNAALTYFIPIKDYPTNRWLRSWAVNFHAPFVLSQEFAALLPPDAGGAVINLLDERVWNLTPYFVSYTMTKAALWTLTRTTALALAPRIRVNGIGPGPTMPSPRQSPEQFLARCRSLPLRRGTSPSEIAAALRFILAAPAMTGQMIALDGGEHLGWRQPGQAPLVE